MKAMCPDNQILSIYFDGELDSPWKEKFESHLENCASCQEHLSLYRRTRQELVKTPVNPEKALVRVWENSNFTAKRRVWNHSISIPVPIAAAAGLVMVLTMAALIALKQPIRFNGGDPQLAGIEMQEMIPTSDMANFFQYLGSDNSAEMVIIRLPEATFTKAGEPRMIRAVDYSRRGDPR
jgi:hypothetical protein